LAQASLLAELLAELLAFSLARRTAAPEEQAMVMSGTVARPA
jgi:hypothetical protein